MVKFPTNDYVGETPILNSIEEFPLRTITHPFLPEIISTVSLSRISHRPLMKLGRVSRKSPAEISPKLLIPR